MAQVAKHAPVLPYLIGPKLRESLITMPLMRITSSTIKTDEQSICQIFSQTISQIRFYD
jgi:hypothetical protein